MIGELVMKLFHARTAAHVLHLKTRSYAQHAALASFYDDIVGLADTLAETWQGDYGLIPTFPPLYKPYSDPSQLMDDLSDYIEKNRDKLCDDECDSHIQNIVDEICALICQTQYKLKFLK